MTIFKTCFFCSCFIFLGCTGSSQYTKPRSKDNLQTGQKDKEFTISPGEGKTINGIEVYLLDIEDSRCPSDRDCENSGTVILTLKIKINGKASDYPLTINLNGNQYLTDTYDIGFISVNPERGKQSQEIPKSSYKVTLKLKNTAPSFQVVEIKNPSGIIFPKDGPSSRPGFKETNGSWSPLEADARKADGIVQKYLENPQQVARDIKTNNPGRSTINDQNSLADRIIEIAKIYPQFRRQYLGYLGKDTGHKLVLIHFLTGGDGDFIDRAWKKEYIFINYEFPVLLDNVLVDLETGKCLKF
jgi:hypothetical protein